MLISDSSPYVGIFHVGPFTESQFALLVAAGLVLVFGVVAVGRSWREARVARGAGQTNAPAVLPIIAVTVLIELTLGAIFAATLLI
ncbi:Uncharacterised protein (plasmid) [Tsukamurella tyrosinosolvens]|uniref:Uncharacterized protein n=1 Tax=Tsukamurella tyrosinosolvens TaxID=57704 RepID=A0A1H4U4S6_TSUTY|nr:hypothetical protein [Tsukamurella tyrosinosolvens]KXO93029.1 hypothetical protein AXK58_14255 [Tsukamurella tyrosinosolvens]SEC63231.1 hypothetical protein SAMN04489793_2779 [Tsukamurella tyrosinosolvens]VEH93984.1 Uncharacterised protein [Tsukamurella tyrosinosolvens]